MAYNNGFMYPQYYPQANYMQQPLPQGMNNGGQQTTTPQMQNGGFISVPSEEVARNYPVAHGNSITFKDENAPYVYTKTMGFSQLDRPIFEKFRLIREEDAPPVSESVPPKTNDIDEIRSEIEDMWSEINALKERTRKPVPNKRKEDSGDRHDE